MPVNLAALKVEVETDPQTYGYAAHVTAGEPELIAEKLNKVRDGTDGEAAISVNRGAISSQELVEAIVQSEMPTNASQRDWLIMVASGANVRVDTGSTARSGLLAIFNAASVTRTNLLAAASRTGSRAEQLFGAGTAVSAADVGLAMRS